ncbi:MAG: hypothetical protein Q9214_001391 [Letrouitia sp. 1 TL-2023]
MDHYRTTRPYAQATSQPTRNQSRTFSTENHTSRTSPTREQDSDRSENQPRRRIGLAVNSTDAFLSPVPTVEYPYTVPSSEPTPGLSRTSGALGSAATNLGAVSSTAGYPYPSQSFRTPSLNSAVVSSAPSRNFHQSLSGSYGISFNEDAFDQYGSQQPHYLLHPQEAQNSASGYSSQDLARQWVPIAGNSRSSNPTLGFEHESSRYGSSNFPYINSSAMATMPSEGPFPAMGPLARSLPRHSSSGNRKLPNPTRRLSIDSHPNTYMTSSGESTSHGLPPHFGYKSSLPWPPEIATQCGSQDLVSSASLSTVNGSDPVSSTASSSPDHHQRRTTFGYTQLSSSAPSDLITSTSEMNSTRVAAENGAASSDVSYHPSSYNVPKNGKLPLFSYNMGHSTENISNIRSQAGFRQEYNQLPNELTQHTGEQTPFNINEKSHISHNMPKVSTTRLGQARRR